MINTFPKLQISYNDFSAKKAKSYNYYQRRLTYKSDQNRSRMKQQLYKQMKKLHIFIGGTNTLFKN